MASEQSAAYRSSASRSCGAARVRCTAGLRADHGRHVTQVPSTRTIRRQVGATCRSALVGQRVCTRDRSSPCRGRAAFPQDGCDEPEDHERGHVGSLAGLVRCAERFGEPVRGDAARDRLAGGAPMSWVKGKRGREAGGSRPGPSPPQRLVTLGRRSRSGVGTGPGCRAHRNAVTGLTCTGPPASRPEPAPPTLATGRPSPV